MTKSKSILSITLLPILVLLVAFLLSACGHSHQAVSKWSSDDTSHWHACVDETCTEQLDKATHTYGQWTNQGVIVNGEQGQVRECTVCGHKQTKTVDVRGFTISQTVKDDADAVIDGIIANVYNNSADLGKETTYSVAQIQEKISGFEYYVAVGTLSNIDEVASISFNGITLTSDEDFYLSIGNSNQILDKAFYVEGDTLYVAGTIVAFESVEHSTIKINDKTFDFAINEPANSIELTNVRYNDGSVSSVDKVSNTEYTLNIKSGTECAELYYEGAQKGDVIITKRILNGELSGYGILNPLLGTDGYYSYLYAVGWVEDFSQVNVEKFDGAVYDYSIYIVNQDAVAKVTFNIDVITETNDDTAQE